MSALDNSRKLRRIIVRRVEPDPIGVVHESDVIEIPCGPLHVVVMRAECINMSDISNLRDAISAIVDVPVLVVGVKPTDRFELYEEVCE